MCVYSSIKKPIEQICINAGVDEVGILKKVLLESGNVGYNAKSNKIEDLDKAGIIDAAKVLICALTNAASSAGMILTSEVLIVDVF